MFYYKSGKEIVHSLILLCEYMTHDATAVYILK